LTGPAADDEDAAMGASATGISLCKFDTEGETLPVLDGGDTMVGLAVGIDWETDASRMLVSPGYTG